MVSSPQCICNIRREGAKKMEPGSSQGCSATGPNSMRKHWNTGGSIWTTGNIFFHCEGEWALEQHAQRGCGFSMCWPFSLAPVPSGKKVFFIIVSLWATVLTRNTLAWVPLWLAVWISVLTWRAVLSPPPALTLVFSLLFLTLFHPCLSVVLCFFSFRSKKSYFIF